MRSVHSRSIRSPSFPLLALEPMRAVFEYARFRLADEAMRPPGDGHRIVVFPGLGTNKWITRPLMTACERLGYEAVDWGHGFNLGPQGEILNWIDSLARSIEKRISSNRPPVTLIGWSLGGIYAREVAKRFPRNVRQVITIGTPISGSPEATNAATLYRMLNGRTPPQDSHLREALRFAPPVPVTSIFSKSDGIVSWKACLAESAASQVENVEVYGSHCGMCWNPQVHDVLADRLAQPLEAWTPYRRSNYTRRMRRTG